jgi:hypothetical protein
MERSLGKEPEEGEFEGIGARAHLNPLLYTLSDRSIYRDRYISNRYIWRY